VHRASTKENNMSVAVTISAQPRVTIVLATKLGPTLTGPDRDRLHRLINRVAGYLRDYPPEAVDDTLRRLRSLADNVLAGSVEGGLQLTVGPGVDEIKLLSTARADRLILEPTRTPGVPSRAVRRACGLRAPSRRDRVGAGQ
jgi:hypothetical protein